jgi:hypothetical protein
VDVTTRCNRNCAHCTRGIRHIHPEDRAISDIRAALESLRGWQWGVCCMGGEPTIHHRFRDLTAMWREYIPKWRAVIAYGRHVGRDTQADIDRTFGLQTFNDHTPPSWHEPIFVAPADIGLSVEQARRNIERCWLHWNWTPVVVPGVGCYFCEVVATIDRLRTGGQNAMPIERGWWKRDIPAEQLRLCYFCGIPHGLQPVEDTAVCESSSKRWQDYLNPKTVGMLSGPQPAAEHIPYAQRDQKHYRITRGPRIWARQKWTGFAYRWRKALLWPLQDMLRGRG